MPTTINLANTEAWIFDLDNTLYPVECDLGAQLGRRMGEFVARFLNLPLDQAKVVQKSYFAAYGTTLRGLMLEHHLQPKEYLDYVHDLDLSGLPVDRRLGPALAGLPGRKVIYTNATREHAQRVLKQLDITPYFDGIFDIADADFLPKPNQEPYAVLLDKFGINPRRAVMIEDIAKNLVPADDLGMTTVWDRGGRTIELTDGLSGHVGHIIDDLAAWLSDLRG